MSDPASTDIMSDSEPWTVLENLILAQAIYKCGDTNWVAIARTIKGHPQVHRSSNFFSPRSCATQYTQLSENLEAETRSKHARNNETGTSSVTQDIPSVVKLAGQLYNQRILEIKALIRKDEERFRALVAELEDIRQGKWDNQLAEELKNRSSQTESTTSINGTTDNNSSADASQLQPEGENVLEETTAPSSVSSPQLTTLQDQEESDLPVESLSGNKDQSLEDVSEVKTERENSGESESRTQESTAARDTSDDVEMEDAEESQAALEKNDETMEKAETPKVDEEDVVMEDATSKASPQQLDTIDEATAEDEPERPESTTSSKNNDNPESAGSSPTSASDLSPPEVMEEEEDTVEDEKLTQNGKADDNIDLDSVIKSEDDSHEATIKTEIEAKDSIVEEESTKPSAKKPAEESSADENQHKEEEDEEQEEEEEETNTKDEDTPNDINLDEEATQDGAEDGATSADDEESTLTKTGKKPKKIKTTIPIKRKRRPVRGVAGVDHEEGYNSTDSEMTDSANTTISDQLLRNQMDDKKWKKILMMIWADIANHRYGAVFMQPIKEQDAPGYYSMIKRPMDLKSIKERIRDGQITNADEFHRDVLLMFMNALMYNGEDTEVYQMALAMMTEVEFTIKNFKSSQSFAPISSSSGLGGSGNTSNSTTPTTRTAGGAEFLSSGTGQPSSRKRKSSGMEMTPAE